MNLVTPFADGIYDATLALVYPQACAVCGGNVESRHDGVACARCWNETRLFDVDDTLCWKCGALSRVKVHLHQRRSIRCGRCDDDAFTVARACGLYEKALRASILQLKRQPHVARRLSMLIREMLRRGPLNEAELIMPVPLHAERERERGFNQALVLARELSRQSGLPFDAHSVIRRIHTERHRAGMDAKGRRQSVEGAFTVRHADNIKGKSILLIDDVFTTGATVSACGRVLLGSGADKVLVMTVARA